MRSSFSPPVAPESTRESSNRTIGRSLRRTQTRSGRLGDGWRQSSRRRQRSGALRGLALHSAQDLGISVVSQSGRTSFGEVEFPGEYPDDELRRSDQHGVGILGGAWPIAYGAVDRLNDHRLVAGAQLDRDRRKLGRLVAQVELCRQREPVAPKCVLVGAFG